MLHPVPPFKFPANANVVKRGERLPFSDNPDLSTTLLYFPVKPWAKGEEQVRYYFVSRIFGKYLNDKIRFKDQQTYSLLGEFSESEFEDGENLMTLLFYSRTEKHRELKENILAAIDALSRESPEVIAKYMKFVRDKNAKDRGDQKCLTAFWT